MAQQHKRKLLAAVNRGIKKANKRAMGEFDGLHGSLPKGTSIMLSGIISYLREYLLEERRFSRAKVRALLAENLPMIHGPGKGFRAVSKDLEDEGVRVALGVLNSIASVLRVRDGQIKLDGRPLSAGDAISLLFSGRDGLRGARVKKGGSKRGADTRAGQQDRRNNMQRAINEAARKYPNEGFRRLAERVAGQLACDERTVRRHTQNPRKKANRDTIS